MITDKSKAIESTTMTLAKRLSTKYMEQKKWSETTSIIRSTLQRTWSSFLSASVHDVTLTSTFLQESIELVERLAECYLEQRQIEKVEDVYLRLFRAVLVSKQSDNTLLDKVKWLLINFYDKHGYSDRAISIFQDVLVVYRRPTALVTKPPYRRCTPWAPAAGITQEVTRTGLNTISRL